MAKELDKLKRQRTLVLIKPEGVQCGLIGEIITRFERAGLRPVGLGLVRATRKKIDGHYPKDLKWIRRLGENTLKTCAKYNIDPRKYLGTNDPAKIGKMVRVWLVAWMTAGPIVKMVVEGPHAIDIVRKLAGPTLPNNAEAGTIRGDLSSDSAILANLERRAIKNVVHASETPQEAAHEIHYWFNLSELVSDQ